MEHFRIFYFLLRLHFFLFFLSLNDILFERKGSQKCCEKINELQHLRVNIVDVSNLLLFLSIKYPDIVDRQHHIGSWLKEWLRSKLFWSCDSILVWKGTVKSFPITSQNNEQTFSFTLVNFHLPEDNLIFLSYFTTIHFLENDSVFLLRILMCLKWDKDGKCE